MLEYIQQFLGKEKPELSKETRETIRHGYLKSNSIMAELKSLLSEEQVGKLKNYRNCARKYMQLEIEDLRTAAFALGILLGAEAVCGAEKSFLTTFFYAETPFGEREHATSKARRRCEEDLSALDETLYKGCPTETVETCNDLWTAEADIWFSCREEVMADALRKGLRLGFSAAELWQNYLR